MASAGAGIVLNHLSNLKLKSGIAPICDLRDAGVRLGLGGAVAQRRIQVRHDADGPPGRVRPAPLSPDRI